MPVPVVVLLRSRAPLCCGHRAVALENFALCQQLTVFGRKLAGAVNERQAWRVTLRPGTRDSTCRAR
jgi:hypothetical protein